MLELAKSRKMFERACEFIAGGVNSAMRGTMKPFPLFFERGEGSKIYDVDGNKYIDYSLSFGPLILGHRPAKVVNAVKEQIDKGWIYGAQHELEIKLSEKLAKIIPCAELTRYSNTGTEAVQMALRLARAYTGKNKIIKFEGHYHGWLDNILISYHPKLEEAGTIESPHSVLTSSGQVESVLKDIIILPWNNLEIFEEVVKRHKDEIAGIITEPMMCNSGVIYPAKGYLEGLRKVTSENKIILIFDEVITGFRLALGGAQEYFNVIPDIAVFGKAMAAGFPISSIAGKRDIMNLITQGKVIHAGTFNSNPISIAAAYATVTELEKNNGGIYKHIFRLGNRLKEGIEKIVKDIGFPAILQGPGPMFHLFFTHRKSVNHYRDYLDSDMEIYEKFIEYLLHEGILSLSRGIWYISAAHSDEDIERTLEAVEKGIKHLYREVCRV